MQYKFEDITVNSTVKKKPTVSDKDTYLGLDHLDPSSLTVTRFGSEVAPIGEKLIMKKGDVLFGKRRAYQKKVAIAPFDGIFSAHGMVLRPKEAVVDIDFFPLFISSDYFLDAAIKISVGSLSPTINWRDLKELEFELPPLDEQRRLAKVLWAAVETRNAYKELLALTEQLVKSQFIEMFGDLGSNPMKWKQIRLLDTCAAPDDIKCGPFGTQLCRGEYQKSGVALWGIPQINSAFQSGPKDFLTDKKAAKLEAYSLQPGDIAMSRKGNVGMCALFPEHFPIGIIHSDVLRIRPNTKVVNPVFLMSQLHYSPIVETQIGIVSNGAIMAGINVTKLKTISVHLPPLDLQTRFADFVQQADKSKFVALELVRNTASLNKYHKSVGGAKDVF